MNKNIKKMLLTMLMIISLSVGASLTIKAAIGIGAWDALAQTISNITNIKIGTMGMILNIICIGIQAVLLKKEFGIKHLAQIAVSVLLGFSINFVYYNLLGKIEINSYIINLLLFILGMVIASFSVGAIMVIDYVTLALEGACMAVSNKFGLKFPVVRQWVDIFSIAISIALSLIFSTPLSVREGTVLGMLIFSPLMGFAIKKFAPIADKIL